MLPDAGPGGGGPLVLGFDTSAAHCAAALLSGDRLVAARAETMDKGQAERLMPLLEEMLADAGLGWRDLAALGVGVGPGNFTGVRIAVAAARGLSLSLGIPAIGVNGFDALAEGHGDTVATVIDARRGSVYIRTPRVRAPRLLPRSDAEAEALAHGLKLVEPGPPDLQATAIARIALRLRGTAQPRPAPLYLRDADAAPPADPPPVLLP
ncbi:tRNA (adenosine(37)-N6)-threonylcarbamoyltransferase complex dimerization subunit type 1 TsaB [Acidimangrovimonas sediminis]|uniref:tRNA (adenosine(37)-N6)-threonylcarbamoyltransferase complex dimerization subunit type 1 TsaB n=1 Tax=Acidimangrovimonas sediminis TaxID=2056283 RepID=UPI001E63F3BF|nr:tRNA (adenosine(37)-N6)-threonylcarbamoyltransferase complex dimerization subunit type 1 TsaB [Acidimangrovimonas sediminis]